MDMVVCIDYGKFIHYGVPVYSSLVILTACYNNTAVFCIYAARARWASRRGVYTNCCMLGTGTGICSPGALNTIRPCPPAGPPRRAAVCAGGQTGWPVRVSGASATLAEARAVSIAAAAVAAAGAVAAVAGATASAARATAAAAP